MTETTVAAALRQAQVQLAAIGSARLDAELLLAQVMGCARSRLHSRPETLLSQVQRQAFDQLLQRRQSGEPLAYLLGEQDFWSLTLSVTPAVLVPRPDTELLVEVALSLGAPGEPWRVADLGTGSGAIILALASERPAWQFYATDQSADALAVAQANAQRLGLDRVQWYRGSWCHALPAELRLHCIVSNPPYIDAADAHLQGDGLRHEPRQALVAEAAGLADLRVIIHQAPARLLPGGFLLLEHGYNQAPAVRQMLQAAGFETVQSRRDLAGHERVSLGQWPAAGGER